MGRRNRKSADMSTGTNSGSKEIKYAKLSKQSHLKRSNLISTLFMYASTLPQKITTTSLWETHQQINDIIQQLIRIECELKVPLPARNKATISELEKWAKENGCELNKCTISQVEGYGYGLLATDFIDQANTITSVPKKLMITVDCIKGSPLEQLYNDDILLQQLPYVALAIFLLVERFRTDECSFWLPYFSALPENYSTCMYFSMEDLNELRGSPALESSIKMYKNIARQYGYFWSIFQKNTDDASNILREVFTYEQYRWAVSTVMTRQNYIPCPDKTLTHVIIPVWDFCNHSNNKDKENAERSTTYDEETESCVCVAPQDFAVGQQINIFYGERSNADFLIYNGFVYPQNDHDAVKVKFGISNSDSYMLRLALLRKLKLPASGEYLIKADRHSPIHASLLAFVRIFKMNEEQLNEWMEKDSIEDVLLAPIGNASDVHVLQYIHTRMNILLKAYPTQLEEDEKKLEQEDLPPIRRLVVMQRITEKRILSSACAYSLMKIAELKLQQTDIS